MTLRQAANQWVEITSGKVKYRIVGMAAESFPTLPSFENVDFFAIDGRMFREMVEKTLYAVSTDETRYNLTGVYCEPVSGSPWPEDGGHGRSPSIRCRAPDRRQRPR